MNNMCKFTCVILCAAAASLSSVYAEEKNESASYEELSLTENKCMLEYGLTHADIEVVVETGDVSKVNSCYWGCYFREGGLLNDKGQFDLDNYVTTLEKLMVKEAHLDTIEYFEKHCISVKDVAVTDGEAGCERGALLAACYLNLD